MFRRILRRRFSRKISKKIEISNINTFIFMLDTNIEQIKNKKLFIYGGLFNVAFLGIVSYFDNTIEGLILQHVNPKKNS